MKPVCQVSLAAVTAASGAEHHAFLLYAADRLAGFAIESSS